MKPDERVLDLLSLLLDARRPVPTRDIYEAFPEDYTGSDETRERKLSRDKDTLRKLGIPVEYVPGDDEEAGGYVVDRAQMFLPEIALSPPQRAALFAVGAAARAGAFPLRSELAHALTKLRASSGAGAELVSGVVATPSRRPDVEATIMEAVTRRRKLKLRYPPETTERIVDPYAFSARRGRFHLVGYCHLRQGVRTFSSDRITSCGFAKTGVTKPEFEVPEGFDAEPHLPRHPWQIRAHAPVPVELAFTEALAESGPRELGIPESGRFEATNLGGLVAQLLALGPGVTIVAPEKAKERFAEAIDALARAHAEAP